MAKATKAILVTTQPTKREIIAPILEQIRSRHDGCLLAEDVVAEAESNNSPLHPYFNWNDTAAAHQYRLWQARELITLVVVKLPDTKRATQMYVSLRADRATPGGAYRGILDVLSKPQLRTALVMEALEDLRYWERKYAHLAELANIYEAIQAARKKFRK